MRAIYSNHIKHRMHQIIVESVAFVEVTLLETGLINQGHLLGSDQTGMVLEILCTK